MNCTTPAHMDWPIRGIGVAWGRSYMPSPLTLLTLSHRSYDDTDAASCSMCGYLQEQELTSRTPSQVQAQSYPKTPQKTPLHTKEWEKIPNMPLSDKIYAAGTTALIFVAFHQICQIYQMRNTSPKLAMRKIRALIVWFFLLRNPNKCLTGGLLWVLFRALIPLSDASRTS